MISSSGLTADLKIPVKSKSPYVSLGGFPWESGIAASSARLAGTVSIFHGVPYNLEKPNITTFPPVTSITWIT